MTIQYNFPINDAYIIDFDSKLPTFFYQPIFIVFDWGAICKARVLLWYSSVGEGIIQMNPLGHSYSMSLYMNQSCKLAFSSLICVQSQMLFHFISTGAIQAIVFELFTFKIKLCHIVNMKRYILTSETQSRYLTRLVFNLFVSNRPGTWGISSFSPKYLALICASISRPINIFTSFSSHLK